MSDDVVDTNDEEVEQPKTPEFAIPDLPLKRLNQLIEQPSTSKESTVVEDETVSFLELII